MKKVIGSCLLCCTLASTAATANEYSGWGNLHFDYQAWGHGVSDSEFDQALIGIEGGLNFEWGELFGFYDFEGLDRNSGEQTATYNLQAHTYIGNSGASVFSKVYSSHGTEIKETNSFLGFGYTDISGGGWWFTPWVAGNYTTVYNEFAEITNVNGFNGATFGWSAGYVFEAFGKPFLLSNWTEIEMFRNDEYAHNNYGRTGVNGGLNLGMDITKNINATVMYRYYYNKLGADGYGDIMIYRLAYKF
ncbi:outer membrane protein OmpK (plasmid) [Photobacterium sp. DA100]|uniref:outer membrane protein OmpK n=1 Tax=Photobacterium sp. DA100 TaxID=3027472 RepID=UPI0024795485|nr:outer membrane protein OmpK [Photobacterium sp. DA100]WEM44937.1 outer membrane protein OmpK [Photobacterium sp. DA100]